jgi:hypothetical protein
MWQAAWEKRELVDFVLQAHETLDSKPLGRHNAIREINISCMIIYVHLF